MPWFVVFEIAPPNAFGIWERRGLSSGAETKEAAIDEVREALFRQGCGPLHLKDVFQYRENEHANDDR